MTATATHHRRNGSHQKPAPLATLPDRSVQEIRTRAYDLYLARCADGTPGDALSDWLRAEKELGQPQARSAPSRLRGETLLRGED